MSDARCRTVLVVEDEPGDARLLQLALKQSGHALELHLAGDGHEALAHLRRKGEAPGRTPRLPDLILLDLKMSGQGGLELLDTIKRDPELRIIPVVVVTTSSLNADVLAAYRHGAAGYVGKPADIDEFITAISKLCHYWFTRVRLPEIA